MKSTIIIAKGILITTAISTTIFLFSCTGSTTNKTSLAAQSLTYQEMIDSLLWFRSASLQTDLLSRQYEKLDRQTAFQIQLDLLKKSLENGSELVGWKMGGTVASDSVNFNPVFGYILRENIIEDGVISRNRFPGGSVLLEGEVGFVIKKDMIHGVDKVEDLKSNIEAVIGVIEIAQSTAKAPEGVSSLDLNYTIATGMGQVATLPGPVKIPLESIDLSGETVSCYFNDSLQASGSSSSIYHTPLNALYHLANMLPEYGQHLKAGQLVITGSVYTNPVIDSPGNARLDFENLGSITLAIE